MTRTNKLLTQTEEDLLHHPENFIFPPPSYKEQTRAILKDFFDQQQEKFSLNNHGSELLVDGFDPEQIWAQLKPLNSSLLKFLKYKFKELKRYPPSFSTDGDQDDEESLQQQDEEEDADDLEQEDEEASDIEEEDHDLENQDTEDEGEEGEEEDGEEEDEELEQGEGEGEGEDEEVEGEDGDEEIEGGKGSKKKDRFFSLEEMNNFINQAEEEEQRYQEGDFALDQFDEDDDEEEDEEDEEGEENEDDEENGEEESTRASDDMFDFHSFSKSVNAEAPPQEDEDEDDSEKKTPHQERLSKLQKKIQALEAENLAPKPWALSGEVNSRQRPEASLLEVSVDYDNNQKKPTVITQDITKQMEDIIQERIKQRNWDDVVRKAPEKPKLKKKFELDQEKSKLSLAEIYEKKFLKEIHGVDKEEEKLTQEQKRLETKFKGLMKKLDALSNFVYTPIIEDVSVVSTKTNAPSISLEEALPVAVSTASTLAPEQVVKKKIRPSKGLLEISKDDRKKERRRKKRSIKKSQTEEKLKLIAKKRANPNFMSKKEVSAALDKKNVTIADTKKSHKDYTQSATMFASLNQPANKSTQKTSTTSIANLKY